VDKLVIFDPLIFGGGGSGGGRFVEYIASKL